LIYVKSLSNTQRKSKNYTPGGLKVAAAIWPCIICIEVITKQDAVIVQFKVASKVK